MAAGRGAIGGAAGAAGVQHGAGVAAFIAVHGVTGRIVPDLDLEEADVVRHIQVEGDADVDDIIAATDRGRVFVQCKRTCGFGATGPFGATLDQWIRQVETDFDAATDRLVLAVEQLSGNLRYLAHALDRRRALAAGAVGELSTRERTALDELEELLTDQPDDVTEAVMSRAYVYKVDLSHVVKESALASLHLAAAAVVSGEQCTAAFRSLRDRFTQLAAERGSVAIDDLAAALAADFEPPATAPATEHALRRAAAVYGARIMARRDRLRLGPLGTTIGELELPGLLDDFKVATVDESDIDGVALRHAVRRHLRCFVVGLPGSGKSTAMEQLAAHAAARAESWPVPILARLKDVAASPPGHLLDRIIATAARAVAGPDQEQVRVHLGEAVREGRALLLLDGLDECANDTPQIAQQLADLLDQLAPSVEVVVTGREPVLNTHGPLGLRALELQPTKRLEDRVRAAISTTLDDSQSTDDRVQDHVDAVMDTVGNQKLGGAPLIPMLLAVQRASGREAPTTPGESLSAAIGMVVDLWEVRHRSERTPEVAGMSGQQAVQLLQQAFNELAFAFAVGAVSIDRQVAVEHLLPLLTAWGIDSRPRARAAADDLIAFWEDSGLFIGDAQGGQLTARIRPVLEVGQARRAAQLDDAARADWLAGCIASDDAREPLRYLTDIHRASTPDIVAAAIDQGADDLAADLIGRHVDALSQADLLKAADHFSAALNADTQAERWTAINRLLTVPLPPEDQEDLVTQVRDAVDDEHADLLEARLHLEWQHALGDDPADLARRLLSASHPPRVTPQPTDTTAKARIFARMTDLAHFHRTSAAMGEQYPDAVAAVADQVAAQLDNYPRGPHQQLMQVLNEVDPIALDDYREQLEIRRDRMSRTLAAVDDGWDDFHQLLSDLGDHLEPGWEERRGMTALSRLYSLLEIGTSAAGAVPSALARDATALSTVVRSAARLGDLDLGLIATEAELVANGAEDSIFVMYYPPPVAEDWSLIGDTSTFVTDLAAAGTADRWLGHTALKLLWSCPDTETVAAILWELLVDFAPDVRWDASKLIAVLEPTHERINDWTEAPEPYLRLAAIIPHLEHLADADARAAVAAILSDPDATVRTQAAGLVAAVEAGDLLHAEIVAAIDGPRPERASCQTCEQTYAPTATACPNCRRTGSDWRQALADLLRTDESG